MRRGKTCMSKVRHHIADKLKLTDLTFSVQGKAGNLSGAVLWETCSGCYNIQGTHNLVLSHVHVAIMYRPVELELHSPFVVQQFP